MVEPQEAQRALDEVRLRKRQVVERAGVPAWHWLAVGALGVVFSAGLESRRTTLIIIGSTVFAVGLTASIILVVTQAKVQVHRNLIGARGALAIVSFVVVLVGLSLALGFTLEATGVPYPATVGSIFTAVGLAVGGPLLMRRLRAIMRARAAR